VGAYLVRYRLVPPGTPILSLQGAKMGRPSRIHIDIEGGPETITRVRIGGEAVLIARGDLVAE
jgi:predicted PhzF superfamily epimerase YddE/YHI9